MKSVFLMLFLISRLNADSFECFPGEGKKVLIEQEGKVKILTWNILGLPNDKVAVRPWEERIEGIAKTILLSRSDIVILQECFEKDLSLGLYERLKKDYAYIYLNLSEETTQFPSGLALFSKIPVAQLRFTPHPDLLDNERNFKMGILDFLILNQKNKPIAHIAGSHFQGSSGCEWRVGVTEAGARLSYPEVRTKEALFALNLEAPNSIPHYLCGDLNVDRRAKEFYESPLNSLINPALTDRMTSIQRMIGTNTSFSKHRAGLAKLYPELSAKRVLSLALDFQKFYEKTLSIYLNHEPWNKPLSEFEISFFSDLEKKIDLSSPDLKLIWNYFKTASLKAIESEKKQWQENHNPGAAPPVSIGRLLENRAVPAEESLDYILGTNPLAVIYDIQILMGYVDGSIEKTLSDHHPVAAIVHVAESSQRK